MTKGWLKHEAGAAQMATYIPNYTDTKYGFDTAWSGTRGMSDWCSACHTQYNQRKSGYNYGATLDNVAGTQQVGARTFHRHPVNVSLAAGDGPGRALAEQVVIDPLIPLEESRSTRIPRVSGTSRTTSPA